MPEAIDAGADAFFDEKYGETVRTVRVEGYCYELCGGTHCRATGQIGGFVITGERSDRVRDAPHRGAHRRRRRRLARHAGRDARRPRSRPPAPRRSRQLPDRIGALQDELRETKRRLRAGGGSRGCPKPGELAARRGGGRAGRHSSSRSPAPFESIDALKGVAKDVRGRSAPASIALGLEGDEPQLFVTVSDDLVARGVSAGDLVQAAVAAIDGRGGGRPEMAQGKGTPARRAAAEALRGRSPTGLGHGRG